MFRMRVVLRQYRECSGNGRCGTLRRHMSRHRRRRFLRDRRQVTGRGRYRAGRSRCQRLVAERATARSFGRRVCRCLSSRHRRKRACGDRRRNRTRQAMWRRFRGGDDGRRLFVDSCDIFHMDSCSVTLDRFMRLCSNTSGRWRRRIGRKRRDEKNYHIVVVCDLFCGPMRTIKHTILHSHAHHSLPNAIRPKISLKRLEKRQNERYTNELHCEQCARTKTASCATSTTL